MIKHEKVPFNMVNTMKTKSPQLIQIAQHCKQNKQFLAGNNIHRTLSSSGMQKRAMHE